MAAEVVTVEATRLTLSSSNLLSDTQSNVLASSHPGRKEIIVSETLLDYFYPHAPPEGDSEDSSGQGKDSLCTVPSGEGKDSLCTVPSGDGKDSLCTVPPGKGKDSFYKIKRTSGGADSGVFLPSGNIKGPTGLYSVYSGMVTNCLPENVQTCPGCPASPAVTQAPANKVPC